MELVAGLVFLWCFAAEPRLVFSGKGARLPRLVCLGLLGTKAPSSEFFVL